MKSIRLSEGIPAAGTLFGAALLATLSFAAAPAFAAPQSSATPPWLLSHVGAGAGQIAAPVLERARDLYLQKSAEGKIRNSCYFAMDATRPNEATASPTGGRFYIICEAAHTFRVISSGHGSGRNLKGVADFSNGRACARNFGNAQDSNLTMGGNYITGEAKTSYRGYYQLPGQPDTPLLRTFIQFNGEGETANARARAIGGHPAALVSHVCRKKDPESPYANHDGYVLRGNLVDYSIGRSDGCTSWSPQDARDVIPLMKDNPTTLYIYPESKDIAAIDVALASGHSPAQAGLYWNSDCLKEIGQPKFWAKQQLEPVIAQWAADHPPPPPKPAPLCQ